MTTIEFEIFKEKLIYYGLLNPCNTKQLINGDVELLTAAISSFVKERDQYIISFSSTIDDT